MLPDELRHASRPRQARADTAALRLPEHSEGLRSPSARTTQLHAPGFDSPAGYDLVQAPRRRSDVVVLRVARSRRQASALDGASAWVKALATRLALALTGRV